LGRERRHGQVETYGNWYHSQDGPCQREHALGMQALRKQRSQELVDALKQERLLGRAACKPVPTLITLRSSGVPA